MPALTPVTVHVPFSLTVTVAMLGSDEDHSYSPATVMGKCEPVRVTDCPTWNANSVQGNSKPVNMPILEKAEEFIIKAQESGFVRSDVDAKVLADDLCIVEKGTIFDWCICSGSYDLREYADRILRAHLRAYVTDAYIEKFTDSFK